MDSKPLQTPGQVNHVPGHLSEYEPTEPLRSKPTREAHEGERVQNGAWTEGRARWHERQINSLQQHKAILRDAQLKMSVQGQYQGWSQWANTWTPCSAIAVVREGTIWVDFTWKTLAQVIGRWKTHWGLNRAHDSTLGGQGPACADQCSGKQSWGADLCLSRPNNMSAMQDSGNMHGNKPRHTQDNFLMNIDHSIHQVVKIVSMRLTHEAGWFRADQLLKIFKIFSFQVLTTLKWPKISTSNVHVWLWMRDWWVRWWICGGTTVQVQSWDHKQTCWQWVVNLASQADKPDA
jgi:hypothetical protein